MRLIRVAVKPHGSCRGRQGPHGDGVLRSVTDRLDLPAEPIAEMHRLRWIIEMIFRTFRHLPGCRHLFSDKHDGVKIRASPASRNSRPSSKHGRNRRWRGRGRIGTRDSLLRGWWPRSRCG